MTGSISLLMGYNLGFEADEFQWPFNILRYAVLAVTTAQGLVTIFYRRLTPDFCADPGLQASSH
jgi:cytochrome c oxidase cbb3-type subunit I/II